MNFDLYGKIKLGRETDKFKPYQEREFESGWANRTLMFNAICGDNRHMLTIQGGTYPNKSDYKIITFSQGSTDASGTKSRGEKIEIPWKDRLLQSNIDKVAAFRKFTVDLDEIEHRKNLETFANKVKEGTTLTDEELEKAGITEESQIFEALEKSNKKKKEFISAWDFAEFMKKVMESGKYDNSIFHIRGSFTCQWSDQNQQWYISMTPQQIYLAKPGTGEKSEGTATLFFTNNAVDDMDLEEKHKYYVNAYTFEYDSARKKNIPCPFQLVIPDKIPNVKGTDDGNDETRAKYVVSKFVVEDGTVKEYGVKFDILNGAQKVDITPEMLTDEQRDDLEMGLIDMSDIIRELGSSVYGERVRENRYSGIARGYTKGRKDTAYAESDLEIPPLSPVEDVTAGLFDEDDL